MDSIKSPRNSKSMVLLLITGIAIGAYVLITWWNTKAIQDGGLGAFLGIAVTGMVVLLFKTLIFVWKERRRAGGTAQGNE